MINFNYQIVIETKRIDFNNLFDNLDKNIYLSNDDMHRSVIEKYKEYLNKLSNQISVYDRKFYFITEQLDMESERRLIEGFNFLGSLGVKIERIMDNEKIFSLLYELVNKMQGADLNGNR